MIDRELDSVLVALSAPSIESRVAAYFDADLREMNVAGLRRLTGTMSTAEGALIQIAVACWQGTGAIPIDDLTSLDEHNARRALTALAVRLGLLDHHPITLTLEEALR